MTVNRLALERLERQQRVLEQCVPSLSDLLLCRSSPVGSCGRHRERVGDQVWGRTRSYSVLPSRSRCRAVVCVSVLPGLAAREMIVRGGVEVCSSVSPVHPLNNPHTSSFSTAPIRDNDGHFQMPEVDAVPPARAMLKMGPILD
jgi:hypothetical protein